MTINRPKPRESSNPARHDKGISAKPGKPRTSLAEHEFKPMKSEFEQLVDNANDAIRVINKDFTVRRINRAFAEMTGVGQNAAIGKKCWEMFLSSLCRTPDCRMQRILDGERMIQVEIERKKKDGATIPCMVTVSPLMDEMGELTGIIEQFHDITEHRHMEEQVRESEERYQALVELGSEVGEAIVMLQDIDSGEGIQTFVSDQWPRMTGYSREELLGSCFFDLLDTEDRPGSIERHRLKMSGTTVPGQYVMQINHKDGTNFIIEVTGAFTTYQGKRANVLYIRDITERKLAETKLKDSEERFRTLFEDVPVAIWELDYSEVKKYLDSLRVNGVTDIRNYFYQHPETTLHCLKLGRAYDINQAAIALWEAESKEQLNSDIFDLIQKRANGLDRDRENYIAWAEGATEISYINREVTFKGHLKYTSVRYLIAPGHEKDWARVFASFFDITERIEAEKELMTYKEHLEDLVDERTSQLKQEVEHSRFMEDKLRELYEKESQLRKELEKQISQRIEFTRTLVHELKTPLTPMRAASELLESGIHEEPWHSLAGNINKGALGLNKRIDELLDMARSEMGVLRIERSMIDPSVVIKHTINFVSPSALARGIMFVSDIQPQLPVICVDEERLFQVLLNLLDNAFKFTDSGGTVKLEVRFNDNEIVFKVTDTGKGIAQENQPYLFQPYHQLKSTDENLSGMGLGLALCKSLVELHDGKIWLESQLGRGSTFAFQIPREILECD